MAGEELYGIQAPKAYGYAPEQVDSLQYAPAGAQGVTQPQSQELPPEVQAFLEQNIQAQTQPAQDTFQKSGPGLGTAVLAGAGVGTAAGAGTYFWGSNPLDSDGIFKESFLSQFDKTARKANTEYFTKMLILNEKIPTYTKLGITSEESYEAVKKLAKASKIDDLADELKGILPAGVTSPEDAKKLVESAEKEFVKIDLNKIAKEAAENAYDLSMDPLKSKVAGWKKLEGKITNLADDIPEDKLKDFITKNQKLFRFEGTEDEIKTAIEELTAKGKAGLLADIKTGITNCEDSLSMTKTAYNTHLTANYDDAAKAFKEGSPEHLQKALDAFKRNKSLKAAGIAAGITAAALGLYFAVTKSGQKEQA